MGQTLLAVLALALLTFLSFGALSGRNDAISEHAQALVREESRGLAIGVLDRVAVLPFTGSGGVTGTDSTTLVDQIIADADGLDDLAGMETVRAEVLLEHPVSGLENPLVFEAGFTVEAVALDGSGWVPTADSTSYKRVTFRALHPQTAQQIELERIYADLDTL